ncbi:MAG: hypothetical protein KBS89_06915 [Bacteroidales bacterium]|nr:hypothetical protein [Candidatus Egerieousia equi]
MRTLFTAVVCLLLASCSPRIITQTERITEYQHDTIERIRKVPVEILVPVEVRMAVSDTTSFLETSVAESQAYVDSTGRLHHYLANKAVPLRDTVYIPHLEVRTVEKITKKTTEEKPLTWWEKVKLDFGGLILFFLAISVLLNILIIKLKD